MDEVKGHRRCLVLDLLEEGVGQSVEGANE
jgi:hypothetical protein